jgi:aminoglycoside phosphotransferase (APT) family kinase protein
MDERIRDLVNPTRWPAGWTSGSCPGRRRPIEARFISGGASNEIFEIARGDARLALRRPPRKVPKGRNETMLREYRVLAALRDSGVPHTRAVAACDDPASIGACFYLMEFVDGWSCMNLDRLAGAVRHRPRGPRGLAYELVDAIAKLASVDWKRAASRASASPRASTSARSTAGSRISPLQVPRAARPRRRRRMAARRTSPPFVRPASSTATISSPTSCSATARRRGMAAIVDWEMAPSAIRCSTWPGCHDVAESRRGAPPSGYVDYTGMPSREELLERYARDQRPPVDEIDYYVILARFKMAVVLEGGYAATCRAAPTIPRCRCSATSSSTWPARPASCRERRGCDR